MYGLGVTVCAISVVGCAVFGKASCTLLAIGDGMPSDCVNDPVCDPYKLPTLHGTGS